MEIEVEPDFVTSGHFLEGIKDEPSDHTIKLEDQIYDENMSDKSENSEVEDYNHCEVALDYDSSGDEVNFDDTDWNLESPDYFTGRDKSTKWSRTPISKTETNIPIIPPQPIGEASGLTDELEAFYKIIDPQMIDMILEYTNAEIISQRKSHNRERDANVLTNSELLSLFGILYLLGTMKAKDVNVTEFWATDGTGIEILRASMSYKRFYFLSKALRFDDKNTRKFRSEVDKLSQIRPIMDLFVKNCNSTYHMSDMVQFGEVLVPFRGKCSFNRYVPEKDARYGIKMYAVVDARTNFVSNLEVYCGNQNPKGPYHVSNNPKDVVMRLSKNIQDSGRVLTVGKRFGSYQLARSLLQKNIKCVCELKNKNVEVPFCFIRKNSNESVLYGFQKDVTLLSYDGNDKTMLLLSTKHHDGSVEPNSNLPHMYLDFQATKGTIDHIEELCNTYTVARRTRRWAINLFHYLMNIAGINAHILYSSNEANKKIDRRVFLKNLAMKLLHPRLVERAKIKHLPGDILGFLNRFKAIQPELFVEEMEVKKMRKRGRCKPCGRAKDVNTTMKCGKCFNFICKRHSYTFCYQCAHETREPE